VPARGVVAGHGLGVGREVVDAVLPELLEAFALGVAELGPDDLGQLLGVLLQLVVGGLPVGGGRGQHAAHLAHGEQGVLGVVLLELSGQGPRRLARGHLLVLLLVLGRVPAHLGGEGRAGAVGRLGVAGGRGREDGDGEDDRTGS
jgi:hypothetical protein